MMNNSNGFQGSSLLGNSNGFKKTRTLLRPASGTLSKRLQFLRAVDISQSQPIIASLIRSEVASIEQQINLLDKDKRIRQSQGGLQKGYATTFRKWLRQGKTLNEKEDDESRILKHMGADSYESGFRKLWKISCQLDLMVTKISQLQIIHFLLYDDMFEDISKDSQKSSGILSSIANNGYTAATFQITQVLLDRAKDVYAATKKGANTLTARNREESKGRQQTNELIAQLRSENAKLTSLLQQLSAERQSQKRRQKQREKENGNKPKQQKSSVLSEQTSPREAFKQIEQKYQEQLKYLTSEKARAEETVVEMKVKVATLQSQVKADAELLKIAPSGTRPKAGSYEQALMEEMQKMKKGFQKKIAVLTQEFSTRERQLRKKQAQYKTQNQKIKWQKSLLLKKFELIPQK